MNYVGLLCPFVALSLLLPWMNNMEFMTVRTYVIHLLGTYVTILCNWLIL